MPSVVKPSSPIGAAHRYSGTRGIGRRMHSPMPAVGSDPSERTGGHRTGLRPTPSNHQPDDPRDVSSGLGERLCQCQRPSDECGQTASARRCCRRLVGTACPLTRVGRTTGTAPNGRIERNPQKHMRPPSRVGWPVRSTRRSRKLPWAAPNSSPAPRSSGLRRGRPGHPRTGAPNTLVLTSVGCGPGRRGVPGNTTLSARVRPLDRGGDL
jgi:hypothetical protein